MRFARKKMTRWGLAVALAVVIFLLGFAAVPIMTKPSGSFATDVAAVYALRALGIGLK